MSGFGANRLSLRGEWLSLFLIKILRQRFWQKKTKDRR
ncbi:hypothetical protein TDIS_0489 [Thermosulfurimonas dismutans]|uniref:Uncharacterized protein n=1 Tax=Thermosulfurimonas dismutans TaxID=999894 RepID=A0A179D6B4_9BACT|nr:hypothetical protein TDIS_0489 [Thermosulfurimonas dismutans]